MFPVKQQSPLFHRDFAASRGANGDFLVCFPKRYRFVLWKYGLNPHCLVIKSRQGQNSQDVFLESP